MKTKSASTKRGSVVLDPSAVRLLDERERILKRLRELETRQFASCLQPLPYPFVNCAAL